MTHATLSDRLKRLTDDGLVERRQYQTGPDRYEYLPTSKGKDLALVIQALAQVGDKWKVTGDGGPPMRFNNRKTGGRVKLVLVDEKSGDPVRFRDIRAEPGPGADELIRLATVKVTTVAMQVMEPTAVPVAAADKASDFIAGASASRR